MSVVVTLRVSGDPAAFEQDAAGRSGWRTLDDAVGSGR